MEFETKNTRPLEPPDYSRFFIKDGVQFYRNDEGQDIPITKTHIEVDIIDENTILLKRHPEARHQGVYRRISEMES